MKNRIREIRLLRELSQQQLAEAVGVSRQAIHAIETERHDPSVSLAFAIARQLKTPIDKLFQTET